MSNKRVSKNDLFIRVSKIIDTARDFIGRTINVGMVGAYWQIGKEIIDDEQKGKTRAEYGKRIIEQLSQRLTEKYGAGWSSSHLWHVRQFYLLYQGRIPANLHTPRADSGNEVILHTLRAELSWSHYRVLMRIEKSEAWTFPGLVDRF